jgi:hypothetical protein
MILTQEDSAFYIGARFTFTTGNIRATDFKTQFPPLSIVQCGTGRRFVAGPAIPAFSIHNILSLALQIVLFLARRHVPPSKC